MNILLQQLKANQKTTAKVDAMLLGDTKKYANAEIHMQNEKEPVFDMSFLQKRLSDTDKNDMQKGFKTSQHQNLCISSLSNCQNKIGHRVQGSHQYAAAFKGLCSVRVLTCNRSQNL